MELDPAVREFVGTVRRPDSAIRVYRPSDAPGLPIHVFMHGGGFWLGSIDERVNEATCRSMSQSGVGDVVRSLREAHTR